MWFTRRSDRPDPARRRLGSSLEMMEGRVLLSQTAHPFAVYLPSDLPVSNPINHHPIPFQVQSLIHDHNPQSPLLNNQGKVVSGKDRAGDEWTITVHGPGSVIVTDTSPNDGSLDDNINTITLIGTSPTKTYVTGETHASFQVPSNGQVFFNKLVDNQGVKSIVLNGFTLTQTIAPPNGGLNNSNTGIFLTGGVGLLQFHNIEASVNQANQDQPINIVIGDSTAPLKEAPIIRLDEIFNTSFNSSAATVTTNPQTPQTTPTVKIIINGEVHGLDIISSTQAPFTSDQFLTPTQTPLAAGNQFKFPKVGTTGRTAVRVFGIDNLRVRGSAVNFTASRGAVPFQNGFSSLDHLGKAVFNGNADGVGLDVTNGKIGGVRFSRGLGNPTGSSIAATSFGTPVSQTGYPASGLLGGLVTARKIGHIKVGPANQQLQVATNPDFVQLKQQRSPTFFPQPGNALTSAAIVSSGSIGSVSVKGDTVNSEIKSGFHYPSFAAGLEGTRAPSKIGPVRHNGNLVNGDISATYRPGNHVYGAPGHVAGPGSINGKMSTQDSTYVTGGLTPLGNQGAGFYARHKRGGYLPPPLLPTRSQSIQVR